MTTVLFDMDGVLVDSRASITRAMVHALEAHGLRAPAEAALVALIGPPLHDALAQAVALAGGDPALVPALVETYRERYRERCVDETPLFPGIAALVEALAARHRLAVVTSKPLAFARPILEARGLAGHLAVIEGPSLAARSEPKRVGLERALAALGGPAPGACVMVGDREHDVLAAAAHGIATVGVAWGIGSREELVAAGAVAVVDSPGALAAWLAARA